MFEVRALASRMCMRTARRLCWEQMEMESGIVYKIQRGGYLLEEIIINYKTLFSSYD